MFGLNEQTRVRRVNQDENRATIRMRILPPVDLSRRRCVRSEAGRPAAHVRVVLSLAGSFPLVTSRCSVSRHLLSASESSDVDVKEPPL